MPSSPWRPRKRYRDGWDPNTTAASPATKKPRPKKVTLLLETNVAKLPAVTKTLINDLMLLASKEEMSLFLRDLLTTDELKEFGNRWKAAQMLAAKEPYFEISQATGLSSRTIARISRWMAKGAGGYRILLNKVKK